MPSLRPPLHPSAGAGVSTGRSRAYHIISYISLVVGVVAATACVPHTRLWGAGAPYEPQSMATLDREAAAELCAAFFLVVIFFLIVQGSDPGYLSIDAVEAFGKIDGLGLLGSEPDSRGGENYPGEDRRDSGEDRCTLLPSAPSPSLELESGTPPAPTPSGILVAMRRPINERAESRRALSAAAAAAPPHASTRRKMCDTCHFAPPLRSHHCRVCKKCVATFDHHCYLIGNCIGERNHCKFWWFLSAQLLGFATCLSIITSSVEGYDGKHTPNYVHTAMSVGPAITVLANIFLWPMSLSAGLVWGTHTVFAVCNLTSFECGKGPARIDYLAGTRDCDMPFGRGVDNNLRTFCCFRDAAWESFTGAVGNWVPVLWKPPGIIVRDSDDWWNHPWENKYYACC